MRTVNESEFSLPLAIAVAHSEMVLLLYGWEKYQPAIWLALAVAADWELKIQLTRLALEPPSASHLVSHAVREAEGCLKMRSRLTALT